MRALAVNRHTPSVTKTAITAQIHEAFNVHGDLCSQITFNLVVAINDAANRVDLLFGEKVCLGIAVNFGDSFILGQINARNPCQLLPSVIIPDAACAEDSHR